MATITGIIRRTKSGKLDSTLVPRNRRTSGPKKNLTMGTSGNQGYQREQHVRTPLEHLLLEGPHEVYDIDGNLVEPTDAQRAKYAAAPHTSRYKKTPKAPYIGRVVRRGGKFGWEIRSRNGNLLFTDHNQRFEKPGRRDDGALASLISICHRGPHAVAEGVQPYPAK